jgi:dihydroneopterin triphosphate diphosphatase
MTGDLRGHTDIGVSTFLLRRHDSTVEVLLLRRATRRFFRHWFPIEGRIEVGETPEQAALREVREETCIHPSEFFREQREPVLLVDLGLSVYVFVGFTHLSVQVVLNDEHSAFAWVHPTEAALRLPLPSQRAALRRIYENFIVQQPEETLRVF